MKKYFLLFITLTFLFNISYSFSQQQTIAILDFSNNSLMDKDKYSSLSGGLAEIFITELSKVSSLKIVERQKINELIQEMQLAQSGMVSEETGVQVGRLVGAKYLVFGSYMVINKKIRVDTRIVEIETGLTIKAAEVTKNVSKMFEIIQTLSEKILKDLNIKLLKGEKKILNEGNTSTEVIELFSKGLEYEESGDLENAKAFYMKSFKMDNNFAPVRKKLKALLTRKK
ncbi:hypothetical protein B6I21_01665 [candidate division KSB1 bacterium 4572_119]|nr:MAG: hypothetical protein B6I21_01665 [candidate division KSB1 bacterium 4572_119]